MSSSSSTVQPRRFDEIAALNALFRPGPMQWTAEYADRKHGRQPITYIFPELEEILAETYGVIVYQEQVMRIAVKIAGFSMARGDTLRKAMGKKIKELIDEQGEHFIAGGVAKGHPKDKVAALSHTRRLSSRLIIPSTSGRRCCRARWPTQKSWRPT